MERGQEERCCGSEEERNGAHLQQDNGRRREPTRKSNQWTLMGIRDQRKREVWSSYQVLGPEKGGVDGFGL